jgi:hypothetical protein
MGWHLIHETHKCEVFHRALPSTSDYTLMLLAEILQNNSIQDVKGLQQCQEGRRFALVLHFMCNVSFSTLRSGGGSTV